GALAQYKQPPDITHADTWPALPATVGNFSVATGRVFPTTDNQINITVSCGTPAAGDVPGVACTAADLTSISTPKYVWMGAVVKLNPFVLKFFTGGNVGYTERLQWP